MKLIHNYGSGFLFLQATLSYYYFHISVSLRVHSLTFAMIGAIVSSPALIISAPTYSSASS